jgi:hypothetical protein
VSALRVRSNRAKLRQYKVRSRVEGKTSPAVAGLILINEQERVNGQSRQSRLHFRVTGEHVTLLRHLRQVGSPSEGTNLVRDSCSIRVLRRLPRLVCNCNQIVEGPRLPLMSRATLSLFKLNDLGNFLFLDLSTSIMDLIPCLWEARKLKTSILHDDKRITVNLV